MRRSMMTTTRKLPLPYPKWPRDQPLPGQPPSDRMLSPVELFPSASSLTSSQSSKPCSNTMTPLATPLPGSPLSVWPRERTTPNHYHCLVCPPTNELVLPHPMKSGDWNVPGKMCQISQRVGKKMTRSKVYYWVLCVKLISLGMHLTTRMG